MTGEDFQDGKEDKETKQRLAIDFAKEAMANMGLFLQMLISEGRLNVMPCHNCQLQILALAASALTQSCNSAMDTDHLEGMKDFLKGFRVTAVEHSPGTYEIALVTQ